MSRLEANREILRILSERVEALPDVRFGQLLRNLTMVLERVDTTTGEIVWKDEFYLESADLLKRIEKFGSR